MRGVVKARTMSLYDSVSSEGSAPAAPAAPPAAAASSDDDKKKAAGAIACVLAVLGYWYFTHNPSTSTEGMPPPPSSAVAPSAGFVSATTILPLPQLGRVHTAANVVQGSAPAPDARCFHVRDTI